MYSVQFRRRGRRVKLRKRRKRGRSSCEVKPPTRRSPQVKVQMLGPVNI